MIRTRRTPARTANHSSAKGRHMDQDLPSVQDLNLSPPGPVDTAAVLPARVDRLPMVREGPVPMARDQAHRTQAPVLMVQRRRRDHTVRAQPQVRRALVQALTGQEAQGLMVRHRVPMVPLPALRGQRRVSSVPQVQQRRRVRAAARVFSDR